MAAFWRLHTTRPVSREGMGPIPWHRAWDYAVEVVGLERPVAEFFASTILCLDGLYRQHLLDEQDKKRRQEERKARREAATKGAMVAGQRGAKVMARQGARG